MRKWVTLAFLCLAFFIYMSDRQLFGLLVPLIQEETGLSNLQIGLVDTVMYWVLAFAMPFSGFAGDRWPRTRVIAVAILGWGVLTLLTGFMGGLLGFILVRSVVCTSVQTFYGPSAYALMADEHKATRTTALSLHQGAMYTGMLVSGALVAVILARFGSWRWVYFLFGGATVLVGIAFAAVFWRDGRMSAASQKKSISDGYLVISDKPGLGIDVNVEEIEKRPYKPRNLRHYTGTLTDIRPKGDTFYYFDGLDCEHPVF